MLLFLPISGSITGIDFADKWNQHIFKFGIGEQVFELFMADLNSGIFSASNAYKYLSFAKQAENLLENNVPGLTFMFMICNHSKPQTAKLIKN
jgi:hypothetical protein